MDQVSFHRSSAAAAVVGIAFGCVGCSSNVAAASAIDHTRSAGPPATAPKNDKVRVSNRAGDKSAGVLILMYHKFEASETRFDRSFAHFASDLKRMYDLGFRPVTMTEYLDGKMDLAPGASPVVMTFDDSNPDQFTLLPDGSVDPNCGIGVWLNFAKSHPDFPVKGTWYILPGVMWHQRELRDKKLALIKSWGSELGSHTWNHPFLSKVDDHELEHQVAKSLDFLEKYGYTNVSLAYPYGAAPKNLALLKGFDYEGKHYAVRAGIGIKGKLAPPPGSTKLDLFDVPRIDAAGGGIEPWLKGLERGRIKVYVEP